MCCIGVEYCDIPLHIAYHSQHFKPIEYATTPDSHLHRSQSVDVINLDGFSPPPPHPHLNIIYNSHGIINLIPYC